MNPMEFGAKQAIVNCLKLKSGEKVVIITDRETEKIADALAKEAVSVGGRINKFVMEDFGNRPDDGKNPLAFPGKILKAVSETTTSIYIAQGKKGEYGSFRSHLLRTVENNRVRHAHMIGFTEEMMSQGMAVDYIKIQALCKKVFDIVSVAKMIEVRTPAGTNFHVTFDAKYKWVICDGEIREDHWTNLPDGEVFTCPKNVEGKIVIDGCLGDFFTAKYGDLTKTPLSYTLKDGRCVKGSVACSNSTLKKEFEDYTFDTDENSNRVGEFAIGTNIGLKKLIGNMLQDEKFPSVHMAMGSPNPHATGANWDSKAHNDGLMLNPTVDVDGTIIMEKGKFKI